MGQLRRSPGAGDGRVGGHPADPRACPRRCPHGPGADIDQGALVGRQDRLREARRHEVAPALLRRQAGQGETESSDDDDEVVELAEHGDDAGHRVDRGEQVRRGPDDRAPPAHGQVRVATELQGQPTVGWQPTKERERLLPGKGVHRPAS